MITKDQTEGFIKALTLAWKRLGLYPPNHPARQGALDAPLSQLRGLLAIEDPVSLAATEGALLVHEQRLDSLPAQELAKALYGHNVGVIRFGNAVSNASLEDFSSRLRSTTPATDDESLVAKFGPGRLHGVGIEVEQVDYSGLVAQQEDQENVPHDHVSLLERLLHLQLTDQPFLEPSEETSFEQFATLLRSHLATLRQQSALLGSLRADFAEQLVEVLEQHLLEGVDSGFHVVDLEHLRRLLIELHPALRYDVLSQLLSRLLDLDNDEALSALESSAAPADLLSAVRNLRHEGVSFSSKIQRLAETLLDQVQSQPTRSHWEFDLDTYGQRIREQLPAIAPATLDDPAQLILHPVDGTSDAVAPALEQMFDSLAPSEQRQAMLTSMLELVNRDADGDRLPPDQLEAILNRLATTFHELIVTGHVNAALAVIAFLKEHYGEELNANSPMVAKALDRFRGDRLVASVVEAVSLSTSVDEYRPLHDLIRSTSAQVAKQLVIELSEIDDRRTRRRLFDFLIPLHRMVLPDVRRLLGRHEWFHVRNGISLLAAMGDAASVPNVRSLALAEDLRVRDAAFRFLLQHDKLIPVEIITQWINSEDQQFGRRVIQLLGKQRQWNAVDPLLELLSGADTFRRQREERAAAIVALAQIGDADAMLQLAQQFDSNLRLQHPDEKRLFYETLAHYPTADNRKLLEKGRESRDAAIRQACERALAREDLTS